MKAKASRRPFSDPYDEMSDREFERHVLEALDRGTTKISLRVPNDLLGRTRQAAVQRGVPYQSLMKVLLDQGIRRLGHPPASSHVLHAGRRTTSKNRAAVNRLAKDETRPAARTRSRRRAAKTT
jgi:CopG antitoxin of type II toxin-antitoxin system